MYIAGVNDGIQYLDFTPFPKYKYGFINKQGKWVIRPQYHRLDCLYNGLCRATIKGKYGVINKKGEWIIDPDYNYVYRVPYSNNFIVTLDKKVGILSKDKKIILSIIYERIVPLSNFTLKVKEEGRWGIMDKNFRWLLKPQYKDIKEYNGLYIVRKNSLVGVMDKNFNWLLKPKYRYIIGFNQGYVVKVKKDSWGILDKEFNWLLKPNYESIIPKNNRYIVREKGKYGIMGKSFNWLLEPKYFFIRGIIGNLYYVLKNKETKRSIFHAKGKGKWVKDLKKGYFSFVIAKTFIVDYAVGHLILLNYNNFRRKFYAQFLDLFYLNKKINLSWWEKYLKKEPSKFEKEFGLWAVFSSEGKQVTDYKYPYPPIFIDGLARMPLVPEIEHFVYK